MTGDGGWGRGGWARAGLVGLGVGVATVAWHLQAILADHALPVGDAGGHIIVALRYLAFLGGERSFPLEHVPPLGHLSVAASMFHFGREVWAARLGVAVWGGVLTAGGAVLGWRLQGAAAALLIPLLLVSIPCLTDIGRDVLMDIPAASTIPWILLLLWESRRFERLGPALGLGLVVAVGVLAKYTFMLWLVPAVLVAGGALVARGPLALVPVLLTLGPVVKVGLDIVARGKAGPRPEGPDQVLTATLGVAALLGAGVAVNVGAGALLGRWIGRLEAEGRTRAAALAGDLRRGTHAGAATALAFTLTLPWFWAAAVPFFHKVHAEAFQEVRAAGLRSATFFVMKLLWTSWPRSFEWLGVAAAFTALALLLRWGWVARTRLGAALAGDGEALSHAPVLVCAAVSWACVLWGVWLHSRILPTDTRYYLYVPLLLGMGTALALCWTRLGRWVAAPVLAALCLVELGWGTPPVDALGIHPVRGVHSSPLVRDQHPNPAHWLKFYLPIPARPDDHVTASREVLAAAVGVTPHLLSARDMCGTLLLDVASGLEVEADGITSVWTLEGLPDCVAAPMRAGRPNPNPRQTRPPEVIVSVTRATGASPPPPTLPSVWAGRGALVYEHVEGSVCYQLWAPTAS